MNRARDEGVVLINVLVVLALAGSIVFVMLATQQSATRGAQRVAAAAQAEALALSGEASAVAALARDLRDAPQVDHYAEAWTAVLQEPVVLETGRFSLTLRDVQGRYNVNRLGRNGVEERRILARLLAALDLPDDLAPQIVADVARNGPLRTTADLALDPRSMAVLAPYVDAYAPDATLNLNTADVLVLEALLSNRAAAQRLERTRARTGMITRDDLAQVGVLRPAGSGFTSGLFDVSVTAEVDGITRHLTSRIARDPDPRVRSTTVIARRFGPPDGAAPVPADTGF
ncbi:type II secretion system protein GspK [Sulfitobacter sabulilitoris]|uniref:Type II secretion system protein K n=1 Tax=Sulfitobacter sabulilitoris TaxID=2562655 RepID=A0A5S3PD46_9RHOB|nr:type II secretion system protein GspK [Sulfitobacter sabulilitoris]TMM51789.1 general secretion pathway protein GspK [Sulfitobacter sabulilitoris]